MAIAICQFQIKFISLHSFECDYQTKRIDLLFGFSAHLARAMLMSIHEENIINANLNSV